jgi:hypothetical protein
MDDQNNSMNQFEQNQYEENEQKEEQPAGSNMFNNSFYSDMRSRG